MKIEINHKRKSANRWNLTKKTGYCYCFPAARVIHRVHQEPASQPLPRDLRHERQRRHHQGPDRDQDPLQQYPLNTGTVLPLLVPQPPPPPPPQTETKILFNNILLTQVQYYPLLVPPPPTPPPPPRPRPRSSSTISS